MSRFKAAEPLEQLELVHAELNRQRDATVDKHRMMYQRSSLLIGAATLVTGVQAARVPTAISALEASLAEPGRWAIVHTASALALAVLATVLALVAAVHGIRAIMVETGDEIDIEKLAQNVLGRPAGLYTAEWSLVRDKISVHRGDVFAVSARASAAQQHQRGHQGQRRPQILALRLLAYLAWSTRTAASTAADRANAPEIHLSILSARRDGRVGSGQWPNISIPSSFWAPTET